MNGITDAVMGLVVAILTSDQMAALVGLVLLDVVLGIAAALKSGTFHWSEVARFYRTNVIPYILGYVALHITISFVIPPSALGGAGEWLSVGTVTLAWGVLVAALARSVLGNLRQLYDGLMTPDFSEPLTRERP